MRAAGTVCEFRGSDGLVYSDPAQYVPMVGERVARAFGVRKTSPAVGLREWTSPDEVRTGKPFWWDSVLEGWAAPDLWMNLMMPPSLGELYEWLGKGGQPVPGTDGIPKAALIYAAGLRPGRAALPSLPTATSSFLLAYSGARFRSTACPSLSNQGESCLPVTRDDSNKTYLHPE